MALLAEAQTPLEEDGDEAFLTECESVAKEFVNLYLENVPVTKGPLRTSSSGDQAVHNQAAQAVARRVKSIGDEFEAMVDKQLNTIMARQSVFEMGLPQFTKTCRAVLVNCSSSMVSGWQQVYTVYYSMAKIIQELRQQPSVPESSRRLREVHIQRFVGPTMQDLGLDVWIEEHGGLKNQGLKAADTKVEVV